jgi:hypothetical protein
MKVMRRNGGEDQQMPTGMLNVGFVTNVLVRESGESR